MIIHAADMLYDAAMYMHNELDGQGGEASASARDYLETQLNLYRTVVEDAREKAARRIDNSGTAGT
jgi:hypothetical protein